ncbi:methylosome subunit pICln-like [Babylonia areolata]|uniref:methylosome subunit pICln-like n=1 Tax=Babylonia areolata TaxID=304850 RepID=UPI003FD0B36C
MLQLTDVSSPTEAIRLKQANTSADVDGQDFGNGTLFIAESCVTWQRESDGQGLNILYPCINCHAISRDLHFFPHECLHLMVEQAQGEEGQGDECREEEGGSTVLNVRFIPLDKNMLQPMYTAMSQCQALHPDPVLEAGEEGEFNDLEEEDEEEEFYYDGEEGAAHLTPAGRARLARFEAMLQTGDAGDAHTGGVNGEGVEDQFEDADME